MAYEPLHHKYRPQTFAELVGQGAIATTLTNALKQNRIAPAYLFCGPRGTGKTSSARILAKSLNCLNSPGPTPDPCGRCQVCQEITSGIALDVVEIDAASNTGVDNIRELIERAQFAPVQCRYKLYVLDEVHMLSTAAFNALLKTLEEPPTQVVFVLATTDPQRVLPTIISRCQRFDFRRIPLQPMVQHLGDIAQQESISLTPDALQIVAQISQGGLRDAESLLDQLGLLEGEITVEAVWELVGAVPERDLLALTQAIFADDGTALLEQARALLDRGREPLIVLQGLVAFYRDLLIAKTARERQDLVAITPSTWAEMVEFAQALPLPTLLAGQQHLKAAEVQIKNTTQPRLWLEIALLGLLPSALGAIAAVTAPATAPIVKSIPSVKPASPQTPPETTPPKTTDSAPAPDSLAQPGSSAQDSSAQKGSAPTAPPTAAASAPPAAPEPPVVPVQPAASASTAKPAAPTPHPAASGSLSDIWKKILRVVEPRATQMLMTQQGKLLALDGVTARVGFRSQRLFKLAQERVDNLEQAFEKVFEYRIKVVLEVLTEAETPPPTNNPPPAAPLPPPPVDSPVEMAPPLAAASSAPPSKAVSPPANQSPTNAQAESPPSGWRNESELDRSVKRFAEFFNGQIIDLSEGEAAAKPPSSTPPLNSEPGPDVPF
ncbi:MAG: DNA polymerase III subunit gamma/tau [Cyanobacteria bacterium P01_D01_bin.14]